MENNREDSTIIALLLLESYFRPIKWRLIEYIYWIITGDLDITLGIAQIKVKNNSLLNNDNILSRIKSIRNLESFKYNYDSIKVYLNKSPISKINIVEICKYYNGEDVEGFYVNYFVFAKSEIKRMKNNKIL